MDFQLSFLILRGTDLSSVTDLPVSASTHIRRILIRRQTLKLFLAVVINTYIDNISTYISLHFHMQAETFEELEEQTL